MSDKNNQNENSNKQENKKESFFANPFINKKEDISPSGNLENEQDQCLDESDSVDYKSIAVKLEEENQKILSEFELLKNQYVRLAADFDNFRKRQSSEKQDFYKSGAADIVKLLLPVVDTLDRAYSSFKSLDDPEKLKESFEVMYRQVQDGLVKMKVEKIKTAGEPFDPFYHQAIMQEETTEYPDNVICAELQCGYILEDKVIRPSMVKVASNPGEPAPSGIPENDDSVQPDNNE